MDKKVEEKIQNFFSTYPVKTFQKGELIIDPSTPPSGLIFLEQGVVSQYAISSAGDELVVNTFKSLSLFPMGWLLNSTPVSHFYDATEECKTRTAPKEAALAFLKSNPDVVFDLMQRVFRGLDGYFSKVEMLMTGNAKAKLITYLLIHAQRFPNSESKITEKDLAAQVGISRETVSRQLQALKKSGLVSLEKGVLNISDFGKLEAELLESK